jgi:hypothetical protein
MGETYLQHEGWFIDWLMLGRSVVFRPNGKQSRDEKEVQEIDRKSTLQLKQDGH